ncbi:MAG TPA: M3 family metallopeptidase [Ignavibacteriaceae bacterium]|nr:M3 family metallopeptidase [Ignavibacteriaceae bacterium]
MDKQHENPFFKVSTLPFQAPPFNEIQDDDYKPAIEEGMKEQISEIDAIAKNPSPPTFENTLVALEKSGQLLKRVTLVFNAVTAANTDSLLQKVQEEEAPRLAAHKDAIFLNNVLFERVKAIYNKLNQLKLDPESVSLITYYYKKFIHAGANLSDADKTKLKSINEEEATLIVKFTNKLLAATKAGALIVNNSSELDGFSQDELNAASQEASSRGLSGKWLIPLQNTTQQPVFKSLNNRETRRKLFENSWNRAERNDSNDTRAVIERIAKLRADKAKLLGFSNYAAWTLEDQMANTPQMVEDFLERLTPATIANEKKEAEEIQNYINSSGEKIELQPWDWNYYADKLSMTRFNLDESKIKPYFELENVLQKGVFYAAHELYGITFKERHDIPVYQKDVRAFEIFDKDGSSLALFYADFFKRDNKGGGAWEDIMVQQSKLLGIKPVVYNVTNFSKPTAGTPALLSYDDVTTMFHEFGHALHDIFSHTQYPSMSVTNVPRDFVEFPSQFNEHWALYPEVLKHYALNYKTGEPMPKELAEKIAEATRFNQGYDFTEILEAAVLDMAWNTLPPDSPEPNTDSLESESLKKVSLAITQVPPRYRSSYFRHIWDQGYAAGYYAYIWSEMLDDDAFEWFTNNGGLTRENGDRLREMILSKGATEDYSKIFQEFSGHKPDIEPLLKNRGLK